MRNGTIMKQRRCTGLIIFLVAGSVTIGLLAEAQVVPSGVRDLAGVFTGRRCVPERSDVCPEMSREGATKLLTARARAFTDAFDELAAPKYDCGPATLPGLFGDPYAFQVEQLADRVTFTYEKDDIVRTVWLEGHGHPEPATGAFYMHGYSTGRYDGNQLVVDTTRFAFDPAGLAGDFMSAIRLNLLDLWSSSPQKRWVTIERSAGLAPEGPSTTKRRGWT